MLALVPRLLGEAAKDHPLPDEEIVRRVLAGEKALFEVLMRRHYHKVYRAVRSVLKDKVEDAMREAYVFAYFHLAQFDGAARFSTWIIWIAVQKAYSQARRSRSIAQDGQYLPICLPSNRSSAERGSDRRLAEVLPAVIGRLPMSYEIHRGRRGVGAVLPFRAPRCDRVVAAAFTAIQRIESKDAGGVPGANPVTIGVHP
jgi:RNA polymerase sigma-70 factor (ECF subfamily)